MPKFVYLSFSTLLAVIMAKNGKYKSLEVIDEKTK